MSESQNALYREQNSCNTDVWPLKICKLSEVTGRKWTVQYISSYTNGISSNMILNWNTHETTPTHEWE